MPIMPSSKKGIQGPRPNPLRIVNKDHQKAHKRPVESSPSRLPPTILYEHTPKVVHASPQEFRGVVQQLTGRSSTPDQSSGSGSGSGRGLFFRADDCHHQKVDNGSSDHDGDGGVGTVGSVDDSMLLLTLGRRQSLESKGGSSISPSVVAKNSFLKQ